MLISYHFCQYPGTLASTLANLWHFGGSIQKRKDFPRNYVATTLQLVLDNVTSRIGRALLRRARVGTPENCVVDFTLVFKALSNNEFPERALTTIRLVLVDPKCIAIPLGYDEFPENDGSYEGIIQSYRDQSQSDISPDAESKWIPKFLRFGTAEKKRGHIEGSLDATHQTIGNRNNELYSNDINALIEILDGVTVPCRRHSTDDSGR